MTGFKSFFREKVVKKPVETTDEIRDCLKIVNWYVRDRQMQYVLRTNILTLARQPESKLKWAKTHMHLRQAFGV